MPFVPLGLVLIIRIFREYFALGFSGINYVGNILLALGWIIGYALGDLDHLFYALMCNPQELSCTRVRSELSAYRFRNAWKILKETASERTKLPVHNILTLAIICVMGIWMVTSSGSLLASGIVVGLSVRLLWEFWRAVDFGKWYWIFAREFSVSEHKVIRWVLTALVILQIVMLV